MRTQNRQRKILCRCFIILPNTVHHNTNESGFRRYIANAPHNLDDF